jgi:hypothetical protein
MSSLAATLERLERHLEMIERKLDLVSGPPPAYAYKLGEAAKMLGMGESKLRSLIRTRKLSTVRLGAREYVPVVELIRLTTPLAATPRKGPSGPRPKRPIDARTEPEKIRELARRKD